MTDFLVLYRGKTANSAKIIAATADEAIVQVFKEELFGEAEERKTKTRKGLTVIPGGRDE